MRKSLPTTTASRLFYIVLLLTLLLAQLTRVQAVLHRWFCVDEFEHLHAAWSLAQGFVPYRDFFEHHTPLLYALLAPILHFTRPERSYESAVTSILICRWIMYALACLTLFLTYRLGREIHSAAAGLMAVLFTLCTMMFLDRATEIRPDMLSLPAFLAALVLTLRALKPRRNPFRPSFFCLPSAQMFFAGLLCALAILATPKSLFWLDGYLAALAILLFFNPRSNIKNRKAAAIFYLAGLALPLVLTLAIFASLHGLPQFIRDNFLLNAHWKFRLNPWDQIHDLAYENPALAALGAAALAHTLATISRTLLTGNRGSLSSRQVLPAAALLTLILGIFIIPVPYTEYFLPIIPLLAIYQSTLILNTTSRLKNLLKNPIGHWSLIIDHFLPALLGLALLLFILLVWRPSFFASLPELLAWCLLPFPFLFLLQKNQRHLAVLLLLVMLTLFPLRFLTLLPQSPSPTPFEAQNRAPNNLAQLQSLAYIQAHSSPADTVFDGWQHITAPFRPHAFHYFFLHREIRPMLPPAAYGSLLTGLSDDSIHPALIIVDEDFRALPPEVVAWFYTHYHPTGEAHVWARNSQPQ